MPREEQRRSVRCPWLVLASWQLLRFSHGLMTVQLAIFLVLAVVVGVIAAVVPARRGARLQVLEALHAE